MKEKSFEEIIEKKREKFLAALPSQIAVLALEEWSKAPEDKDSDQKLRGALTESFCAFVLGDKDFLRPLGAFIFSLKEGCKMEFLELLPCELQERAEGIWGWWPDDDEPMEKDSFELNVLLYEAFTLWLLSRDIEACLSIQGLQKFLAPRGGE